MPLVAVSMGDCGGIGAEVIVKALADERVRGLARWAIVGLEAPLGEAAARAGVSTFWRRCAWEGLEKAGEPALAGEAVVVEAGRDPARIERGPCAEQGALSFDWVEKAIALAKRREGAGWRVGAIVTAPISKEAWALAGQFKFPGHTELVAARLGVNKFAMMFHAPPVMPGDTTRAASSVGLNVILATTHLPLRDVAPVLRDHRVLEVIELGAAAMGRLGVERPRIGVCGLNPHAGEHGMLGTEDDAIIAPAIKQARKNGIDATGPLPGDTAFQGATWTCDGDGRVIAPRSYDLVVAMYHDQGLGVLKTLAWDRAVNMTVGLPIPRTSPDHGTAFDIAGMNRADAGSMRAAMRVAARMAKM